MNDLPAVLVRSVPLAAPRPVAFAHFVENARFAAWWGAGSTVAPEPGGPVRIVHPNGVTVHGTVREIVAGTSLSFTWGYDDPNKPIAREGSLVTLALADAADGCVVTVRHAFADDAQRAPFDAGWRFHLAQLANLAADAAHAQAEAMLDAWFLAWNDADDASRGDRLARCTTDTVRLQDRWSCLVGRADLHQHIGICLRMAPGTTMARTGPVRHCQGTALVGWRAQDAQGTERGQGTNVVTFAADGRIAGVVGFW